MRALVAAALLLLFGAACSQRCANADQVCDPSGCAGVQLQQACAPEGATCNQCAHDGGYALRMLCVGSDDAGYWSADMCSP